MAELSDAVLVDRCRAGDTAAFSLLVTRHIARVRRLLLAVVGNPAEIDDLLQETFLRAYLNLDSLRDPSRFRAWVCGIGINLARMRLRSLSREALSLDELEGVGVAVLDSHPSPERLAEQRETVERLNRALADLPPSEQEALLLVYRDGFSHRETAEFLGISLSAVKVRVHRGRSRLQNALQVEFSQQYRTEVRVKMVEVTVYDVIKSRVEYDGPLPDDAGAKSELEAQLKHLDEHRVILLKEKSGERVLPMWVGPSEGTLIAWHLRNEEIKRPTSYDLMKTLLDLSETQIEHVAINRLHEEIFYATLDVRVKAKAATAEIDCRPSDATNLALRLNLPIFVAEEVMDKAAILADDEGGYRPQHPANTPSGASVTWESIVH